MQRRLWTRQGVLWILRSFPGTLVLTAVVVAIGVLTGTVFRAEHRWILDHLGLDLDSLRAGRLWTMPVATLIQAYPGIKWHGALLLLLVVGSLEYLAGTRRAMATFFLSDWLSSPLTSFILAGLGSLGSATAEKLAHTPDMGSSAGSFGAAAAAAVLLPRPWRRIALAGLAAALLGEFTFERLDVSIAHLIAAAIGGGLGLLLWRRHRIRTLRWPSLDAGRRVLSSRRLVS